MYRYILWYGYTFIHMYIYIYIYMYIYTCARTSLTHLATSVQTMERAIREHQFWK